MTRFYSARALARARGISPSTASRRWDDFPGGTDERGRRWVEVPDDAELLRYPRPPAPQLRVVDARPTAEAEASTTTEREGSILAALLAELEAKSRHIDKLLDLLKSREAAETRPPADDD